MKKTDFVMRSYESEDKTLRVTRTRTSSGFASITISANGETIRFDNEEGNVAYEQQAGELARLIEAAATDTCSIPPVE